MTLAPLNREDVQELLQIVAELEGLAARSAYDLPDALLAKIAGDMENFNSDFGRDASARGAQPGKLF